MNVYQNNHIYKFPSLQLYGVYVDADSLSWTPLEPVTSLFKEEKTQIK